MNVVPFLGVYLALSGLPWNIKAVLGNTSMIACTEFHEV